MCSPQGCTLFVSFLSQTRQYWEQQCSKTEREKGQQNHPVPVKGFQCSYVRNVRAGAFHGGKMPSFALVVLAPGPAETQGTRSSVVPASESSSSAHAKPLMQAAMHSASHKAGEKKTQTNTIAIKKPQTPYPFNLTGLEPFYSSLPWGMCSSGWDTLF